MAINVSIQHNGGFLPDIIKLLTQCYYHRGTRLNAMKRFCIICSLSMIPPKRFDIFPPAGGCSEDLQAFTVLFKNKGNARGKGHHIIRRQTNRPEDTSSRHL